MIAAHSSVDRRLPVARPTGWHWPQDCRTNSRPDSSVGTDKLAPVVDAGNVGGVAHAADIAMPSIAIVINLANRRVMRVVQTALPLTGA